MTDALVEQSCPGTKAVQGRKLSRDEFLELYSVDGPLGQGAFGAVMRGTDRRTLTGIAIKMVDKAQAAGAADEEIRVWRLVRHPACQCGRASRPRAAEPAT